MVVVIVLFASTVALLGYANYRNTSEVRSTAEKVKAALVNARSRALQNNLPSAVVFDLDNHQFWVDNLDMAGDVRQPKVVPPEFLPPNVLIDSVRLASVEFLTGQRRVVFQPDGTNPFLTINLRRFDDTGVNDEGFYAIQMYPTSPEPRIYPNERR